jgi:hypothetical protein
MRSARLVSLTLALACAASAAVLLGGCDDSLHAFAVPPPFDGGVDAAADEDSGVEDSE